ncbi:MAG TPA: hypothetical protein VK756_00440, partial [Solirubrobacteraceae bacterium]|nr:hypothetical protein [Solirubrobacteraceae bacterium]
SVGGGSEGGGSETGGSEDGGSETGGSAIGAPDCDDPSGCSAESEPLGCTGDVPRVSAPDGIPKTAGAVLAGAAAVAGTGVDRDDPERARGALCLDLAHARSDSRLVRRAPARGCAWRARDAQAAVGAVTRASLTPPSARSAGRASAAPAPVPPTSVATSTNIAITPGANASGQAFVPERARNPPAKPRAVLIGATYRTIKRGFEGGTATVDLCWQAGIAPRYAEW